MKVLNWLHSVASYKVHPKMKSLSSKNFAFSRENLIKKDFFWAFIWATTFTLTQVLVCFIISFLVMSYRGEPFSFNTIQNAYQGLNHWDSLHYQNIIDEGYHLPKGVLSAEDVHSNRANIAYFPGYPIVVRGFQILFSGLAISTPIALLLVAQIFCWMFWFQVFYLLKFWKLSREKSLQVAFGIVLFPSSFFLVTGYSESLFLASLVGLILGIELLKSRTMGSFLFAALSGFVLSGTRLVGLPLAIYPLVRLKVSIRSILLTIAVALGGGLFFCWCQMSFGHWDLYLRLQQLGWGNQPNYLAILNPLSYLPRFFFEDTRASLCRFSNFSILAFAVFILRKERSFDLARERWGLYVAAFLIFFVSLAGKANYEMDSMIRYNFPVWVLLLFVLSQLILDEEVVFPFLNQTKIKSGFHLKRIFYYMIIIGVQIWMIFAFTKGSWIA